MKTGNQMWPSELVLVSRILGRRQWQPTPVFLPGESQGRRSLVGCRLWGHTESDTTEATQQQQQQQDLKAPFPSFILHCPNLEHVRICQNCIIMLNMTNKLG